MDERLKNKTMQAVRSKNTKLELAVTKELWKRGIRFRKNVSGLFGKPDIAIKKHKIVIFIDSCFWHGCELHCRLPKKNEEFWINKIERNKQRDKEVTNYYVNNGWNILRIWEHELNENFNEVINTIERFIETNKKR
jgi:DNA mismatch endonuclease, patch repair protein